MLKGLYLTLLIGPLVPVPVPQEVVEALTGVTVTVAAGEESGFQLTFTLSNRSPLQTLFLLSGGDSLPIMRVILITTINGIPDVLFDGVMTHHEVTPGNEPGFSTLTVTGSDLGAVMNLQDFSGLPYPAMTPEMRVAVILAKYTVFGLVPMVMPCLYPDIHLPIEQIPYQKGTDLDYVRYLAKQNGYVFYVYTTPAPGVNIAYWGPEIKVGVPQPALNTNMDAQTNVDSMSFRYDSSKAALPVVFIMQEETGIPLPIPIPDINPLSPQLGLIPPIPTKIEFLTGTAKLNPVEAVLAGLRYNADSKDVVQGTGKLDVLRYGQVLKARELVGVRGAGLAFDGLYYVNKVTSTIKQGEFTQEFSLSRNGLISTVPRVPV